MVILNGYFVAAEFSLVKVRKTRLAELSENGSKGASVALEVTAKLDSYLSACQLGITLTSLGLGWLGEPAIATVLQPLFSMISGWSTVYTHTIALIIAFLTITFLHIVIGELVPKSLAIQRSERTAIGTAGLLKRFYIIFYPAIYILNGLANQILRLLGIPPANEADLAHTEEELRMLVDASERHGYLDKLESTLLDNVFEFSDRTAEEVMVPRQDMVCLYIQDTLEEISNVIKKYGYTRYPLCDDDKDNVVGMIHIRDLHGLNLVQTNTDIMQIKRDILVVPEGVPISHLIQKMRSHRTHLAIVADEYGGTAGLVTIEDLLEELVGEIYDEFDREKPPITKINETDFIVNGRVLIEDISDMLNIEINGQGTSTIGGYIFSRLGRKPQQNDEVDLDEYKFQATEVSGTRITTVKITKKSSALPEKNK